MASSVADIKSKLQKHRTPLIPVTLTADDGSTLVIECRRPALVDLAFNGLLSWPALVAVQALFAPPDGPSLDDAVDNRPIPTVADKARALGGFLDEYVCAACVSPPVVASAADVAAQRGEALCLDDLPLTARYKIFTETSTSAERSSAVTEFRRPQSDSAPDRPGGTPVRDAALVAAGD